MKRTVSSRRNSARIPLSWRAAEYAALKTNAEDNCDDRVSEDIFDVEDEHAAVELIVHSIFHGANNRS